MWSFLSLDDLSREALLELIDEADRWRQRRRDGDSSEQPLRGRSVALVFEKPSTRTRVSLEVAVAELGGHPVVISSAGSQLGRGEPMSDTARVLSRMVHAITLRTSTHERIVELARHATVPVLNALTDDRHPMQLLADLLTVRTVRGRLEDLRYCWLGDGNNMARSWVAAAAVLGFELVLCCPDGYEPDAAFLGAARQRGARVDLVRDARAAVRAADVISTDVFASMGQEEEAQQRLADFDGMRLTAELVALASDDVVVLHCLPAHRGEEIDADVLEGPRSFVWDQAENRLHTAKALLARAARED